MAITINYNNWNVELVLDVEKGTFYDNVPNGDVVRYLKGVFTNKDRFKTRFIDKFRNVKNAKSFFPEFVQKDGKDLFFEYLNEDTYYPYVRYIDKSLMTDEEIEQHHADLNRMYLSEDPNEKYRAIMTPEQREELLSLCYGVPVRFVKNDCSIFECDSILDEMLDLYDVVEPFTYGDAFKIENEEFQAKVFGSIDIVDMIKELGHERIKTDGKRVRHKEFTPGGEFLGYKEYDVVYETHKVDITKLGLEGESAYALRCWCTTTDKEHWLWIEDEYKDNPLEAVASTMRVHKNLVEGNHIKELKRQGDVLLVELNDDVTPEGELVPLTAEQYFGFLTAQS